MAQSQSLRMTQLIFNHGPGAIVETVEGPVVVRDFSEIWESIRKVPDDFEIDEPRLLRLLPVDANRPNRLCRIPSNAELGRRSTSWIVPSRPFPNWRLCTRRHGQNNGRMVRQVLYKSTRTNALCPACYPGLNNDDITSSRKPAAPVRFVGYCKNGHLQEFSWNWSLHASQLSVEGTPYQVPTRCRDAFLYFEERGSTMGQVEVVCSACGTRNSLWAISQMSSNCRGRNPERDEYNAPDKECDERLMMTQRQSAVLWQSVTLTALSIPDQSIDDIILDTYTNLENFTNHFTKAPYRYVCGSASEDFKKLQFILEEMKDNYTKSDRPNMYKDDSKLTKLIEYGKTNGFEQLHDCVVSVLGGQHTMTISDFFRSEYDCLHQCSLIKSEDKQPLDKDVKFIMDPSNRMTKNIDSLRFKISPIESMQAVTMLLGYRRGAEDAHGNLPVLQETPITCQDSERWWVANIQKGEALYIELEGDNSIFKGERYREWEERYNSQIRLSREANPQALLVPNFHFRGVPKTTAEDVPWSPSDEERHIAYAEMHPEFIWWHTFAHHLIRAIQQEAGYSSSAIRERIYAYPLRDNPDVWRGGIILHVTQPGMDGTLGGLVSLVPKFEEYLHRARETARICSNDPLCSTEDHEDVPNIGCYACTFNAETSCEHRNFFLDRRLLEEGFTNAST